MVEALHETLDWMCSNEYASKDDFVAMRVGFEGVVHAAIHQSWGAQVAAKARLKEYCDSCRFELLEEDELEDDSDKAEAKALQSTIEWLSNNPSATVGDFEAKQKELEAIIYLPDDSAWPRVVNACVHQS